MTLMSTNFQLVTQSLFMQVFVGHKAETKPKFPCFSFLFFFLVEAGGFIVQQEYLFDCQWEGTFLMTRMSGLAQGRLF